MRKNTCTYEKSAGIFAGGLYVIPATRQSNLAIHPDAVL